MLYVNSSESEPRESEAATRDGLEHHAVLACSSEGATGREEVERKRPGAARTDSPTDSELLGPGRRLPMI